MSLALLRLLFKEVERVSINENKRKEKFTPSVMTGLVEAPS